MTSQALMPRLLTLENPLLKSALLIASGVGLLSLLAQISVPLPWTPVPITGQTFGVALIALLWGRGHAFPALTAYVGLGALGAPIFSNGSFGLSGPTCGYLIGMIGAGLLVGTLADRGWAGKFWSAWLAAALGSVVTFACGLTVLSFFVPRESLLMAGLWPFLPGDLIKNVTAAIAASRAQRAGDSLRG